MTPTAPADRRFERGNRLAAAGELELAEAAYRQAVALRPGFAEAWTHLGNVLQGQGHHQEAVAAYQEALARGLDHPLVHYNLGTALRALGDSAAAVTAFERAQAGAPESAAVHNNLGNALRDLGRWPESAAALARALALRPDHAATHVNLGAVLCLWYEADPAAAAAAAGAWQAACPDQPLARHLAAALTGAAAPERAADDYVRQTFDHFAAGFDERLAALGYRAPALLAEALAAAAPAPPAGLVVLDAGCGTGLCGSFLRPWAARLAGVDLSPAMLEQAAARGLYDDLVAAELTAFLAGHPGGFDLIVAADVLCYFGALAPVLAAAFAALRPGGRLAFTVEQGEPDGPDFALGPQGRYRHAEPGLRRTLAAAGLTVQALAPAVLRLEGGRPVIGLVVVAEAGAAGAGGTAKKTLPPP